MGKILENVNNAKKFTVSSVVWKIIVANVRVSKKFYSKINLNINNVLDAKMLLRGILDVLIWLVNAEVSFAITAVGNGVCLIDAYDIWQEVN